MSEWWVGRQGANPVGPVTTDTLIRGIVEKKVPEDALVCRVGEQQWQHIAQVDELWEQVHPEQFQTSVTRQPWFADKVEDDLALPKRDESDGEDDSTRIYSVPILRMRTIESSPDHPVPTSAGAPPASANLPTTATYAATEYSTTQSPAAPVLVPASNTAHAPSPRAVIAPPRFGLDRVAPTTKVAPLPIQQLAAGRFVPSVAKPPVAFGPALPSVTEATAIPARLATSASPAVVPLRAAAGVHTGPTIAGSRGPSVDNRADVSGSVPLVQSRPRVPFIPNQPPAIQPKPHVATPPTQVAAIPRAPVETEEDTVTVIIKSSVAAAVLPPAIPAPTAPAAPLPIVPEVEPSDLFDEDFEPPPSKPSAGVPPVQSAERDSVIPRPAAGTPAPPSVIITHRPPSMHDDALAHAVSPMPEETRPAIRSIRPAGTIQVSIGTLVIGALALVVLVLLVVLLLR